WDDARLLELMRETKRKRSPVLNLLLLITDAMTWLVRSIRGLFGGTYGGSFGFGNAGGMIAAASAILGIVAYLLAALALAPLLVLGWTLRRWLDSSVGREKTLVLSQASEFFVALTS